ncbi:MAG: glycosyltransferase family 2 protein [Candidatus Binatia bacterium]
MAEEPIDRAEPQPVVSIVLPCLNEEEGVGRCVDEIREALGEAGIAGEVIVCDNGSTDRSAEIAEQHGARVVREPERGYGNAYRTGFGQARGRIFVMGDADGTYDFRLIPRFVGLIERDGFEFVTGTRYGGATLANMPWTHRLFGNPALTRLLNLVFGSRYTDVYSGFRAFTREAYERMRPLSPGMEYNLELAIGARLLALRTEEVPIALGMRRGASKLRPLRDGWRSLRIILLYLPLRVFLLVGASLASVGLALHAGSLFGAITWAGRPASAVTGVLATIFTVVGFQVLTLGLQTKTFLWWRRRPVAHSWIERFYRYFQLEVGLALGAGLVLAGIVILAVMVQEWLRSGMSPLPHPAWASFAATLCIVGCNVFFVSLLISAMSLEIHDRSR